MDSATVTPIAILLLSSLKTFLFTERRNSKSAFEWPFGICQMVITEGFAGKFSNALKLSRREVSIENEGYWCNFKKKRLLFRDTQTEIPANRLNKKDAGTIFLMTVRIGLDSIKKTLKEDEGFCCDSLLESVPSRVTS